MPITCLSFKALHILDLIVRALRRFLRNGRRFLYTKVSEKFKIASRFTYVDLSLVGIICALLGGAEPLLV